MHTTEKTLSRDEARQFYDRFGAKQDRQGFYEDAALARLVELGSFGKASNVFELGCGTGRLGEQLLTGQLQAPARYIGVELSSTMAQLAATRLAQFGDRAVVHLSDGAFDFSCYGGNFDRVVAAYVLDLLSQDDIQSLLGAAHAATAPGGLFCHCGLTIGETLPSRAASSLWTMIHRLRPKLVGGCRPLAVADLIATDQWQLLHRQIVVSCGIPSEVVIAAAR